MPKTVTIPGYAKPVDFPDSMSMEQVNTESKRLYELKKRPQTPNPVAPTGVTMGAATSPMPKYQQKFQAPTRERIAAGAGRALPAVGATIGAFAGGPVGAGVGAALGEVGAAKVEGEPVSPRKVATSAAEQAALEFVGGKLAPKALSAIVAKASPKTVRIINSYIGLTKSNLPKMGRSVQNAQSIGKTVLEKVGVHPNLEAQKAAIETTRQAYDDATKRIVTTPAGRLYDIESNIVDRAVDLQKKVELGHYGPDAASQKTVDANLDDLINIARSHGATPGGKLNPAQMHAMRREIQHQITDWNPQTLNVRQKYLQDVYHDLNDGIARSLPPSESRQFLNNNRIQSRLITARDAASAKLLKEETKPIVGAGTKAFRAAKGAVGGAVIGGIVGKQTGGNVKEGALIGAMAGATGTAYLHHIPLKVGESATFPRSDVAISQAIGETAEKLRHLSKATPQTVRTYKALKDIQSRRPQN